MIKIISKSPSETIKMGSHLASLLKDGDLVGLIGILGAGKTYFTKGIARGLGVSKKHQITSPSFVLGNLYLGRKSALYHFDAYRISNPKEMLRLGLDESYAGKSVTVLEWADKFLPLIKNDAPRVIEVRFSITGEKERLITFLFGDKKLEDRFRRLCAEG